MIPSQKMIKDTLQLFRSENMNNEQVFLIKKEDADSYKKASCTYRNYGPQKDGPGEALTLRLENEEQYRDYIFYTKKEEVKEMLHTLSQFMQTGELPHLN